MLNTPHKGAPVSFFKLEKIPINPLLWRPVVNIIYDNVTRYTIFLSNFAKVAQQGIFKKSVLCKNTKFRARTCLMFFTDTFLIIDPLGEGEEVVT